MTIFALSLFPAEVFSGATIHLKLRPIPCPGRRPWQRGDLDVLVFLHHTPRVLVYLRNPVVYTDDGGDVRGTPFPFSLMAAPFTFDIHWQLPSSFSFIVVSSWK